MQRRRRETHDTFTLALAPEGGQPWPFAPGQFNMLYHFGVGEVPISTSVVPTGVPTSSLRNASVRCERPALLEQYGASPGAVTQAASEDTLTM